MSWSVSIAAMERADIGPVLDEHRSSKGGTVPDAIVDIIAEEVASLEPAWTKVKIATFGHVGSSNPRYFRVDVNGSS